MKAPRFLQHLPKSSRHTIYKYIAIGCIVGLGILGLLSLKADITNASLNYKKIYNNELESFFPDDINNNKIVSKEISSASKPYIIKLAPKENEILIIKGIRFVFNETQIAANTPMHTYININYNVDSTQYFHREFKTFNDFVTHASRINFLPNYGYICDFIYNPVFELQGSNEYAKLKFNGSWPIKSITVIFTTQKINR